MTGVPQVQARPGNAFYMNKDRKLDRRYLRVCTIYRLLKGKHIGQAEAATLSQRKMREPHQTVSHMPALIELWKRDVLKDMLP